MSFLGRQAGRAGTSIPDRVPEAPIRRGRGHLARLGAGAGARSTPAGLPAGTATLAHHAQAAERAHRSVWRGPELRGGAAAGLRISPPPALQITSRHR